VRNRPAAEERQTTSRPAQRQRLRRPQPAAGDRLGGQGYQAGRHQPQLRVDQERQPVVVAEQHPQPEVGQRRRRQRQARRAPREGQGEVERPSQEPASPSLPLRPLQPEPAAPAVAVRVGAVPLPAPCRPSSWGESAGTDPCGRPDRQSENGRSAGCRPSHGFQHVQRKRRPAVRRLAAVPGGCKRSGHGLATAIVPQRRQQ
jgi:hypothetical protein